MEKITNNHWVIYLGFFLMIIEIILGASTGFDLFLTGLILIISGLIGLLTKNINYTLTSIIILSFIYILILRKFIQNKLSIETKTTNIDSLINKKGVVVKKIGPHKAGQVKIEGEIWRAVTENEKIDIGQEVVIKSISGVTLKVQAL